MSADQSKFTELTIQNVVRMGAPQAWELLFTQEYDNFYMTQQKIGTCTEITSEECPDGSYTYRTIKIVPNVFVTKPGKVFLAAVKTKYKDVTEICYVSAQHKYHLPDEQGVYTMRFETTETSPQAEFLKTKGTICLHPMKREGLTLKNGCMMVSKIEVTSNFDYMKAVAHSMLCAAIESLTKNGFESMLSALPSYVSQQQKELENDLQMAGISAPE